MKIPDRETLCKILNLVFDYQDILSGDPNCYIDENIYDKFIDYINKNW